MKLPLPTKLQVGTVKRLFSLGASYFLSGMGIGAAFQAGWLMSGLIGAGSALVRVGIAMTKAYARDGVLPETEVDRILKTAVDEAPAPTTPPTE